MVKIIYTGPSNAFINIGGKQYAFSQETDYSVDAPWEHVYTIFRDERNGRYMRFEGDPNAKIKVNEFKPGIVDMSQPNTSIDSQKLIVESAGKKEVKSMNVLVDEILEDVDTSVVDKLATKIAKRAKKSK